MRSVLKYYDDQGQKPTLKEQLPSTAGKNRKRAVMRRSFLIGGSGAKVLNGEFNQDQAKVQISQAGLIPWTG